MTIAHFHCLRDGQVVQTNVWEINGSDAQAFTDYLAEQFLSSYCDQVQVWFGSPDGREPDATAEVPR